MQSIEPPTFDEVQLILADSVDSLAVILGPALFLEEQVKMYSSILIQHRIWHPTFDLAD